jgi:hypothetical protein
MGRQLHESATAARVSTLRSDTSRTIARSIAPCQAHFGRRLSQSCCLFLAGPAIAESTCPR